MLESLELLEEFEEFEPEPAEPEPEPGLAEPLPDTCDPPPGDDLPLLLTEELPGVVTLWCVDPGSTAATAPAAITLAKPTVAVAAFSRRRPRSRSATARAMPRATLWRDFAWPRGDPLPSPELLMLPVWHIQMRRPFG